MYGNRHHIPIPKLRKLFADYANGIPEFHKQATNPIIQQLDVALANTDNASYKVVHPLLIRSYRMPTVKFRNEPLNVVGLDIETDAETGRPMLLGFWFTKPEPQYVYQYAPTLRSFADFLLNLSKNASGLNLITWGNLDIQCLIRLFNPDEKERQNISRGISANFKKGTFVGDPPVIRTVGHLRIYISHYIAGRSIKIGLIENGYESTIWVFNCSQFYPGTLPVTAKGLGLEWTDFDKSTHIIDWRRFRRSQAYKLTCLDSNKQDARIVTELAELLQRRFHSVFDCYPSLMVSTGSLTDAAVSKMLSSNREEYQSNSWKWLTHHVFNVTHPVVIAETENLLSEAFSAGYVDQFAIGYFPIIYSADIASAYPHKIRNLPDLRYAVLLDGSQTLDDDLKRAAELGYEIESAIIRGHVTIPDSLKFHPITVKTYGRENYRPTGSFYASYTLDERRFCERYGATFSQEEYVIIALTQRHKAPIAGVSERLGEMRASILTELAQTIEPDRKALLDGQQYIVKVIDNSIYGKTVMTTEVVENVNGSPTITGYVAGDRFNQLYGCLITARTRIQLASACMEILNRGGRPVMCMTDAVYWEGTPDMLPSELTRSEKTTGYFESPVKVEDFYLLKTGQYEYRKDNVWEFKRRGLNVSWEEYKGKESFLRKIIKEHCARLSPYTHAKDIQIPVNTRRLVTIGSHDLAKLAAIEENVMLLKPFIMSQKQTERFVTKWRDAIDGHVWLRTPKLTPKSQDKTASDYPLTFLSGMYSLGVQTAFDLSETERKESQRDRAERIDLAKRLFIWKAHEQTGIPIPHGRCYRYPWRILEDWFGLSRATVLKGLHL